MIFLTYIPTASGILTPTAITGLWIPGIMRMSNEWNCIYSCGLNTFQMNMILKRLRQFTLYKKSAKNVNVNMSINSVAVEIIPVALIFGC